MENIYDAIPVIITAILTIASIFLGTKYVIAKDKVDQFKDVLESWDNMWEDDEATTQEWEDLAKKIKILLGRDIPNVNQKN